MAKQQVALLSLVFYIGGGVLLFFGVIALLQGMALAGLYLPDLYAVIIWTTTSDINILIAILFMIGGGVMIALGVMVTMLSGKKK